MTTTLDSTGTTASGHFSIPAGTTTIVRASWVLWGVWDTARITSVTIPPSVTSIGSQAFAGCNALVFVTIPSSVTAIEPSAFSDCFALTRVTIPASVRYIGSQAFYRCSSLIAVAIPTSVYVTNKQSSSMVCLFAANRPSVSTLAILPCANIRYPTRPIYTNC